MSKENEKTAILLEWIEGVIGNLRKLKTSLSSKESLENLGIASSFQELPCTFDICLTKETGTKEETTRIRRELKHILKKKFSSQGRGGKVCSGEKYQTYVDVGIEHYIKPSKWVSTFWKVVRWALVAVVALLVAVGAVALVNKFSSSKQSVEISQSVVHLLDGTTNLTQKVEMSVKCEERGE